MRCAGIRRHIPTDEGGEVVLYGQFVQFHRILSHPPLLGKESAAVVQPATSRGREKDAPCVALRNTAAPGAGAISETDWARVSLHGHLWHSKASNNGNVP